MLSLGWRRWLRWVVWLAGLALIGVYAMPPLSAAPAAAPARAAPQPLPADDALTLALAHLHRQRAGLGLSTADLTDLEVTDRYVSAATGVTHLYLRQRFAGIEVHNGTVTVGVARDGQILAVGSRLAANLAQAINRTDPSLSAAEAVAAAAHQLGLTPPDQIPEVEPIDGATWQGRLAASAISRAEIPVRLVYHALPGAGVRLAWHAEIDPPAGDHYWYVTVDAVTGELLSVVDGLVHDRFEPSLAAQSLPPQASSSNPHGPAGTAAAYQVYAWPKASPDDGPRTLETDPARPLPSPFGWHDLDGVPGSDTTVTRGNNVHAYTDLNADDLPDVGSEADGGAELRFDFPLELSQTPATYRPAAITNLFYWNNLIHDLFYLYGFDEVAGNFQAHNYGRGGLAGDWVRAEAHDGGGVNNANFFTPPDGSPPRMQMYLFNSLPNLVSVNAPPAAAATYQAADAQFGPPPTAQGLTAAGVLVADDSAVPAQGCGPLVQSLSGQIGLVYRGGCTFVTKARRAQQAGAVALVVINNVSGSPDTMANDGSGADIVIPTVMVGQTPGAALVAALPELNLTVRQVETSVRDASLDNSVIIHEYGHGISNRLVGGPSNTSCLGNTEQMGEGWSDFFALVMTAQAGQTAAEPRGIAAYATSSSGIRLYPYTTDMAVNPSTYDTIQSARISGGGPSPHDIGEVWAAMLWELYWSLVEEHGFNPDLFAPWSTGGNNLALQLVMDGLKLLPCSPGFVDGRDTILAADLALTGGANRCTIWIAFARRGLGLGAAQGSPFSNTDGREAYDRPPDCPVYVDQRATGRGDGTRWTDAFTELQAALDSGTGHEFWVAAGTYRPLVPAPPADPRLATFRLQDGVALYGGFGGHETSRSQRQWRVHLTVLSGDIGLPGDAADNSYHVVSALETGATAVLDGFVISGGWAFGAQQSGAGLYNVYGSPTLANLIVHGNGAAENGGGLYSLGGAPRLTGVQIQGNLAQGKGGGIYAEGSLLVLINGLISGNWALEGGGLYNENDSRTTLTNVTVQGNRGQSRGGGMVNSNGSPATVVNTLFWHNSSGAGPGLGAEIVNIFSVPTFATSLVRGGCPAGAICSQLVEGDPGFVAPLDPAAAPQVGGNLQLGAGSPARDVGNNGADLDGLGPGTLIVANLPTDLAGAPRIANGTVDLGAYEADSCSVPAAPAGLTVRLSGDQSDAQLAWDATAAAAYEIWWSGVEPYFAPGSGCSGEPVPCAVMSEPFYSQAGAAQGSGLVRVYAVIARSSCGAYSAVGSDRAGIFRFELVTGE